MIAVGADPGPDRNAAAGHLEPVATLAGLDPAAAELRDHRRDPVALLVAHEPDAAHPRRRRRQRRGHGQRRSSVRHVGEVHVDAAQRPARHTPAASVTVAPICCSTDTKRASPWIESAPRPSTVTDPAVTAAAVQKYDAAEASGSTA